MRECVCACVHMRACIGSHTHLQSVVLTLQLLDGESLHVDLLFEERRVHHLKHTRDAAHARRHSS